MLRQYNNDTLADPENHKFINFEFRNIGFRVEPQKTRVFVLVGSRKFLSSLTDFSGKKTHVNEAFT